VILAVLFRLFPSYGVRNLQAIVINYFTCFMVGSFILGRSAIDSSTLGASWFTFALVLSFSFITFFNVNAIAVQKVGIVIMSVFQKLSMIVPALFGILLFNENASIGKILAVGLTVMAILAISNRSGTDEEDQEIWKKNWGWPVLVFIGSGFIEVLLLTAEQTGRVNNAGLQFTATLFCMAGIWGLLFILLKGKPLPNLRDIIGGIAIGIPNFFSIYLLVKALEIGWEGSVLFPVANVGVIVLSAITGMLLFSERLTLLNKLGLLIAIIAVYLISL